MVSLREPQIIDLEDSNPIINWTIKAETSKKKGKKKKKPKTDEKINKNRWFRCTISPALKP